MPWGRGAARRSETTLTPYVLTGYARYRRLAWLGPGDAWDGSDREQRALSEPGERGQ